MIEGELQVKLTASCPKVLFEITPVQCGSRCANKSDVAQVDLLLAGVADKVSLIYGKEMR